MGRLFMKNVEVAIPFSVFENSVENNSFALLRFLIELIGKEQARTIISLLAQPPSQETDGNIDRISIETLRKLFSNLSSFTDIQIQKKMGETYALADTFIKELIANYFFEMQFELSLLDNTTTSTSNFATRLRLLSSQSSTSRLKYEMLRQDLLALLFTELQEKNTTHQNRTQLNSFQTLFESELYEGLDGTIFEKDIYAVHSNTTNRCIATFSSLKKAQKFLEKNKSTELHIKKFNCRMRKVRDIGYVLASTRIKSDFSILRKVFYKSKLEQRERKKVSIQLKEKLEDTTGYIFVAPNKKRKKMLNSIIAGIKKVHPEAEITLDHKVGSNRGQSSSVKFLRIKVTVSSNSKPIEIIVFDQIDYMNYLYDLEQAHALFDLRKTEVASQTLFPQNLYDIDPEKIKLQQREQKTKIKKLLLESKRVR